MHDRLNINNVRTHYASLDELKQDAASRETSVEVMYAIAERADDTATLESIWANGTNLEAVAARAWELVPADTNVLYWGETAFGRKTPRL